MYVRILFTKWTDPDIVLTEASHPVLGRFGIVLFFFFCFFCLFFWWVFQFFYLKNSWTLVKFVNILKKCTFWNYWCFSNSWTLLKNHERIQKNWSVFKIPELFKICKYFMDSWTFQKQKGSQFYFTRSCCFFFSNGGSERDKRRAWVTNETRHGSLGRCPSLDLVAFCRFRRDIGSPSGSTTNDDLKHCHCVKKCPRKLIQAH